MKFAFNFRTIKYLGDIRADAFILALVIFYGTILRSAYDNNLLKSFVISVLNDPIAYLIVLILRLFFHKLNFDRKLTVYSLFIATIICLIAAIGMAGIARLVRQIGDWQFASFNIVQMWIGPFSFYAFIFVGWSFAYLCISAQAAANEAQTRANAAEAEALRSELQHLRHQLDPHFLFNALNGVAADIPIHPQNAVLMVRELADFLRYSLDHRDLLLAPLSAEIDAVRSFLEVQQARFGKMMSYKITADSEVLQRKTPGFLLQPLVENAVKHGLKSARLPLAIDVSVSRDGADLRIDVTNAGELRSDWRQAGAPGVGLSVLMRRLELHYPGRHHLELRCVDQKVIASIVLSGEPCLV